MPPVNPLGTRPVPLLLRDFAIPSVIAMLVSSLYNIVDQIFIGQGVGLAGNAATNVAFPLSTVCIAVALLLGIGGAAHFSLSLGAGKREEAARVAGCACTLMVLGGLVIALAAELFLTPMLRAFGATETVLPYAAAYTRITALGFPFVVLSTGMSSLIRADGSPRYSMACMLTGAMLNTVLDPLFIFGFHWGMQGAALATVIGQVASGALVLRYAARFRSVSLTRNDLRPRLSLFSTIASLGMAGCINQLAMMAVQIVLNNTLTYFGARSAYGAEIPLACAGIIIKVNMLCMAFVIGIAQASQPIAGFNYGAQQYARVRQTYRCAVTAATVVCVVAFVCFQLFPRRIIGIFGDGSEQYYLFAERFFRIYMFCTFLNGVQPVTSNFFSSIGKATRGALLALTRQTFFLLPLLALLPRVFGGIDAVMFAGPIADTAAFVLALGMVVHEMGVLSRQEAAHLPDTPPAD